MTSQTPAALGYRMPAEWEPHTATWLSWPRREGISFPDSFDRVLPALRAMVEALIQSEQVCINVSNGAHEAEARSVLGGLPMERITFYRIATNEPWCRDHGPIFLTRDRDWSRRVLAPLDAPRLEGEPAPLAVADWDYNAWGNKYPPFDLDEVVPTRVAEILKLPVFHPHMILEGGSIDVNGAGALLTTESCLLNENRNPNLSRNEIEQRLRDYLGVRDILWLGDGIAGDDTDGHIDDLTRFVSERIVVSVIEEDRSDENYEPLHKNLARLREMKIGQNDIEIVTLPMPKKIVREGLRLPASYANFYIANTCVLVPAFADRNDPAALSSLQKLFPGRRAIGIDCRELIWGLGTFHCLTQQQPAV
ncbi:MAG TPA: agmatine deiminase family protein [Candidatus Udaeobacter sp.]|jgi:agmatine deiminase|nr:agmatine deiminase family protein [Candidatus Udaeobacter sp.]